MIMYINCSTTSFCAEIYKTKKIHSIFFESIFEDIEFQFIFNDDAFNFLENLKFCSNYELNNNHDFFFHKTKKQHIESIIFNVCKNSIVASN